MSDAAVNIERLQKIMNVRKGDKGDQGDPGHDAELEEPPINLTVLFENALA